MTRRVSLSIRQKLLAAFAIDLVLMAFLGVFSLHQMGIMNRAAERVADQTIPSMRHVAEIRDQIVRYHQHQLELMLYTSPDDRGRLLGRIAQTEAQLEELFAAEGLHLQSVASRRAFETMRHRWADYRDAQRAFVASTRRSGEGSVRPAFSRLTPTYEALSTAAERLADLDTEAAEASMAVVGSTHVDARRFVLADTSVSLIVSAAVGLILASTLARRIRHLTSATRRVASGDLDARVRDHADDELAHLADHFDHMVESLREQRRALEARHNDLRDSLDQQRRLTEDLVQRKASEAMAERARADAEARDSAKSLFLATMSHELRTPLNAILGFAQILTLESRVRGEARMEEDLRRIDSAGKHLLTLIDNILDFSKIEQGQMDIDCVELRIDELAQEVADIARPLTRERNNRLRLDIADDLGTIRSDPAKIRQILFNLVSNAIKFTDNGEVTLRLIRHPGVDGATDRVELVVQDTGIGIAAEHLGVIFEPFQQADSSVSRRFGGTGLGLVVSRQLSELLGGSIEVESEPGLGSTFTVHLPADPPPHPSDVSAPSQTLPSASTSRH